VKLLEHFLLLLSLIILASCGVQQTTTTLRLSTAGLALSNGAYQGGLVVVGKSSSGATFSIPVPYSAGSTSEVEITLQRGTWSFNAIGWNGASTLEGDSVCSKLDNVNLDRPTQVVDLTVAAATCNDIAFGNNGALSGTYTFNPFQLITCGSLLSNFASNTSVIATTQNDFCSPTNFPDDALSNARSFRLSVPSITPEGVVSNGALTTCLTLPLGYQAAASTLRLPGKSTPYKIDLYESTDCNETELISSSIFKNGFDEPSTEYDHVFGPSGGTSKLFLSSNSTKKGFSQLINNIPTFKCSGTDCLTMPNISGADRIIRPLNEFIYLSDLSQAPTATCANVNFTSDATGFTYNGATDCQISNNKMIIKVNYSNCPSICTLTNTLGAGNGPNLTFKTDTNNSAKAYEEAYSIIGHNNVPPFVAIQSMPHISMMNDGITSLGLIQDVRAMFIPSGPGGFYEPGLTCATASGTRATTFWDEGVQVSYQVTIEDITGEPVPNYICDDLPNVAVPCTLTSFSKKMILRKMTPPSSTTERVMYYDCSLKIGKLEIQETKLENGFNKIQKKMIYWNSILGNDLNSRFEDYQITTMENPGTGILNNVFSSYVRAEKIDASNIILDSFNFESHLESGIYKQRLTKAEYNISHANNKFLSAKTEVEHSSAVPSAIFTQEPLLETIQSNDFISNGTKSVAYSPSGFMVSAKNEFVATYDLHITRKVPGVAPVLDIIAAASPSPIKAKVVVNDIGRAVVAWITNDDIHVIYHNGTSWLNPAGTSFTFGTPATALFSSNSGTATSLGFDVSFHQGTDNFTVIWHELSGGNSILSKTFSGGTMGGQVQLVSNTHFTSAGTRTAIKDLRIVRDNNSGSHIGILGSDGTDIAFQQMFCADITTPTCEGTLKTVPPPEVYGLGDMTKIHAQKSTISTEINFYIQVNNAGGTTLRSIVSSPTALAAPTTIPLAQAAIWSNQTCFDTAATMGTLAPGFCNYLTRHDASPVFSGFVPSLSTINPFSGIFDTLFSTNATFSAQ